VSKGMRNTLLCCGIASSLLYIAMNIFVPFRFAGYNSASYTVSELSAIGAPTRILWVSLGIVYSLLVVAFGCAVRLSATGNRHLRIAGSTIGIYALVSLVWPFAPMHQREILAAGGETFTDTMHLSMAAITVLLMMIAMGFGAVSFGNQFYFYSITTIALLLFFGALTGLDAPKVNANLPTPWVGVWERINIGLFLLWVIVLAIKLLRPKK